MMFARVAVMSALLAVPAAAQRVPAPVGKASTDCVKVRVTSFPEPAAGTARDVFPASQVQDLRFMVTLQGGAATETVDVRVLGPSGHLYQQMSVPVVPAVARGGSPVADRKAQAAERHLATLPVAGTSIRRSSLYGPWVVEVRPSGRACTARFKIER